MKLFKRESKGKSGNIITSFGRLVLLVIEIHLAAGRLLKTTAGRTTTRYIPEVSVHAAVYRPTVVVCPDSLVITPGAADVVGELKHHWRGKDIRAGQDVSGSTESRRPGTNHCHPQQHRPKPEEEH